MELAWWLLPVGEQFRIAGRAYVVPPPSHPLPTSTYPPKRTAPPHDGKINDGKPFDWQQERLRIYEKLSPALKASFARPSPSQPTDDDPESWPKELQEGDEQTKDLALSRFALIVIEPEQVDWCVCLLVPTVECPRLTLPAQGVSQRPAERAKAMDAQRGYERMERGEHRALDRVETNKHVATSIQTYHLENDQTLT